jgi:hypothetical protein
MKLVLVAHSIDVLMRTQKARALDLGQDWIGTKPAKRQRRKTFLLAVLK